MKKLMLLLFCSLLLCPNFARAENLNNTLLITQIQTGPDEFIEIYNQSDETIDLANYRIEYYSSSSTSFGSPSQSMALSGQIYAGGYVVLASTGYLAEDAIIVHFSKTLADVGGAIRLAQLVNGSWSTVDAVGWGSAKIFETSPHLKAGDGKSLSRVTLNGEFVDTNDNSSDFLINPAPTPNFTNIAPDPQDNESTTIPDTPTEEETIPDENTLSDDDQTGEVIPPSPSLLPPYITELFPDPASPQTDAEDEYVEIYNPNNAKLSLDGYKLQTGNNYTYSYDLDGLEIPPFGYLVLYSKDTNLTLSNTSSRARLLDNSGTSISETDMYSEAEEGQTWALIGGVWQWTSSASPGALNILTIPSVGALLKSSTKPPKSPKATASKAKTTSAKSAKSSTAKKQPAKKEDKGPANNFEQTTNTQKTHPLMLGWAGLFALSYGLYEYRFEFTNFLRRFGRGRIFGGESS